MLQLVFSFLKIVKNVTGFFIAFFFVPFTVIQKKESLNTHASSVLLSSAVSNKQVKSTPVDLRVKDTAFIVALHKAAMLSDENLKTLLSDYENKNYKTGFELVGYCNRSVVLDLNRYSPNPYMGYKQLLNDISTAFPEIRFTNLLVTISRTSGEEFYVEPYNDAEKRTYDNTEVTIEFKVDNFLYTQTFLYGTIEMGSVSLIDTTLNRLRVEHPFINNLNKVLEDKHSLYRLFDTSPYSGEFDLRTNEPYLDQTKLGVVMLTEAQRTLWDDTLVSIGMSSADYHNKYDSRYIQEVIRQYESIGIFEKLTKEEIEYGKREAWKKSYYDNFFALSCFPKVLAYYPVDAQFCKDPYLEIITNLSEVSRGNFILKNFFVEYSDALGLGKKAQKPHRCSFEFKGKKYQAKLKADYYYLDPTFRKLIERALRENQVDGRFYPCLNLGDGVLFVFLSKKQYEYLMQEQPEMFD